MTKDEREMVEALVAALREACRCQKCGCDIDCPPGCASCNDLEDDDRDRALRIRAAIARAAALGAGSHRE